MKAMMEFSILHWTVRRSAAIVSCAAQSESAPSVSESSSEWQLGPGLVVQAEPLALAAHEADPEICDLSFLEAPRVSSATESFSMATAMLF